MRPSDSSITEVFDLTGYVHADDPAVAAKRRFNLRTVVGILSSRAIGPTNYHDGATSGACARTPLGTPGDGIGAPGGRVTVLKVVKFPTAAATRALWSLCNAANGSYTGNALNCYLHSGDKLRVEIGDVTAVNRRYIGTDNAITSRFAGKRVPVAVTHDGTSAAPLAYLNGLLEAATGATTGTPPAWDAGFGDDWLLEGMMQGSSLWQGEADPAIVINAVLTAAEILEWSQTGRLPSWCAIGTGTNVAKYTSDFSASVNGWTTNSNQTQAGNVNMDADSAGVPPSNGWLKTALTATRTFTFYRNAQDLRRGSAVWIEADVFIPPGSPITHVYFGSRDGGTTTTPSTPQAVVAGSVTRVKGLVILGTAADISVNANTSSSFTLATVTSGAALYLKNITIVECGPLAKPQAQPGCCILTDGGDNKIAQVLTPGVTVMGVKPETIAIPIPAMTADGFIHLDQVIVPAGYKLIGAEIERPAGASTGTITIRETSSGGTTVATGTLAAIVELTLSNVYSAAGKKLHLANSSWSSSTITGRLIFRRYN